MPALPRPDLPPGAHQDLVDALHDLHQRAGWPSLRRLANAAGCSHTTVSTVFSSPRLPSWGLVEVLVEELGGDVEEFQRLWLSIASGDAGWSSQRQVEIAGRRDQLAEVRRHLQSGDGLLVVVGEAGIGKTRLTSIAATRVTRSTVGRGACFPLSSATPLLPVITALLDLRGQAPAAWSEAVAAAPRWAMAPVARLIPDIAEDAPADDNDPWAHQRLLLGLSTLLDELHARAPVALLLEDLHWADTTTLEFLEQLLAARHRVPFVATWRSEDPSVAGVNTDWLHRVERVPGSSVLALGLLSEQETREQLVLLTGGEPTPALLRDVYERGRGQPLFTEQLVQPGGDGAAFPRLLADLLGARLADVSGAPWELCGTLAVVDRPVAETLLGSVTGLSPAVLVGALHELRDRALLDTGTEVVALRHPLLGEAISRRLTAMERTDLHRRVAEALSRAPDPDPAEVASHWSSVGDQVRELAWRVRAAQQADVRLAPAGAARQWLRVHELWPSDNEAAASLAVTWGEAFSAMLDALDRSAQVAVAVGFVRDALSLIDQLAPADAADVLTHAGDYIGFLDGPEAGLVHLDRAVELRNGQSPTLGTVRTFEIRAFRLQRLGRHAEARRDLETAVRTSEEINALGWHRTLRAELVWAEYLDGVADGATERLTEIQRLRVDDPDPIHDITVASILTDILVLEGAHTDEVAAASSSTLELTRALGIRSVEASKVVTKIATAARRDGLVDRAASVLDSETTEPPTLDDWLSHGERAVLDAVRGRLPEAHARIESLKALGLSLQRDLVRAEALVTLWSGEAGQARVRLLAMLEDHCARGDLLALHEPLALAAWAVADSPDEVDDYRLRELERGWGEAVFGANAVGASRRAAGATYAAERARAAGGATSHQWHAAATEWDQLGRPHDAAYCRWRTAQVAITDGQRTVAERLLRRAAREARGHVPLTDAIAATAGYSQRCESRS